MEVKIDEQNDIPRIKGNKGTLVYSEKSDTLYIKTHREGIKAIGADTSITETDPIYLASSWSSTTNNSSNWDTAYGWGNHASAGYLTSYTETDPVFTTWLGTNPFSSYLTSSAAAATYQPIGSYLTTQKGAFGLTLSGTLTTGSKGYVILPYNCTITKWYITSDVSGSIVIDVKKSGVSIIGAGNKPTLSGSSNNSASIASWTTSALVDGDVLEFNVDSVATVTKVTLTIKITI